MSFADAVRSGLSKYVTFSGRASRPEYWWFFLFIFLIVTAAGLLDWMLFGTATVVSDADGTVVTGQTSSPFQYLAGLGLFLPHLAVAWRRMHDTGRPGWYVLLPLILQIGATLILIFGIGVADAFADGGSMDIFFTRTTLVILIPTLIVLFVSPLIVLWWLIKPSQPGANAFGPNPHEVN